MPQGSDFPSIDTVEVVNNSFDFATLLPAGITIARVLSMTGSVYSGADSSAPSRLVGSPYIIASPSTGAASSAVLQQIGNSPVGGVTYMWDALVLTSDNQQLNIFAHQKCKIPR